MIESCILEITLFKGLFLNVFITFYGSCTNRNKLRQNFLAYFSEQLFIRNTIMPIGVPKVAYRLPGEPTPQWVDLYNRLYRERVLFLGSELDDELANQLVGIMLFLSAEDESKRLYVYINSPGGSVTAGNASGLNDGAAFSPSRIALRICSP